MKDPVRVTITGAGLPEAGGYGVGNVFLPTDSAERDHCKQVIEDEITAAGQTLIGWRALPTNADGADIGKAARSKMPHFE